MRCLSMGVFEFFEFSLFFYCDMVFDFGGFS